MHGARGDGAKAKVEARKDNICTPWPYCTDACEKSIWIHESLLDPGDLFRYVPIFFNLPSGLLRLLRLCKSRHEREHNRTSDHSSGDDEGFLHGFSPADMPRIPWGPYQPAQKRDFVCEFSHTGYPRPAGAVGSAGGRSAARFCPKKGQIPLAKSAQAASAQQTFLRRPRRQRSPAASWLPVTAPLAGLPVDQQPFEEHHRTQK